MGNAPIVESPAGWVPAGLKVRGKKPDPEPKQVVPDQTEVTKSADPGPFQQPEPPAEIFVGQPVTHIGQPKSGFRPMPILTVLSLICLVALFTLGNWQWTKYVAKSHAPTQVEVVVPVSVTAALETSNPEYKPVIVDGLMDSRFVKVRALKDGQSGYRLFSPVVLEAGWIFVDRGYVSEQDLPKVPTSIGQVSLQGVLRRGAKANAYTPDNVPSSEAWYWPDLIAMGQHLGIEPEGLNFYVALLETDPLATGVSEPNPYADKAGVNQIPAERHLGYALQWWGFGIALIGVYMGLHVRTGRLVFRRARPSPD